MNKDKSLCDTIILFIILSSPFPRTRAVARRDMEHSAAAQQQTGPQHRHCSSTQPNSVPIKAGLARSAPVPRRSHPQTSAIVDPNHQQEELHTSQSLPPLFVARSQPMEIPCIWRKVGCWQPATADDCTHDLTWTADVEQDEHDQLVWAGRGKEDDADESGCSIDVAPTDNIAPSDDHPAHCSQW